MKSVLISIQPKWCELIASGKKTIEVRKTRTKIKTPFKCYIYCTKGKHEMLWRWKNEVFYDTQDPYNRPNQMAGKVIGEFVCDKITPIRKSISGFVVEGGIAVTNEMAVNSCLDYSDMIKYFGDKKLGYGWRISNLKIYDTPKELGEFKVKCKEQKHGECLLTSCGINEPYFHTCAEGGYKPLNKPPQSWFYVEV